MSAAAEYAAGRRHKHSSALLGAVRETQHRQVWLLRTTTTTMMMKAIQPNQSSVTRLENYKA
jgi:hypothetical protein